jgi:hypothetical protein
MLQRLSILIYQLQQSFRVHYNQQEKKVCKKRKRTSWLFFLLVKNIIFFFSRTNLNRFRFPSFTTVLRTRGLQSFHLPFTTRVWWFRTCINVYAIWQCYIGQGLCWPSHQSIQMFWYISKCFNVFCKFFSWEKEKIRVNENKRIGWLKKKDLNFVLDRRIKERLVLKSFSVFFIRCCDVTIQCSSLFFFEFSLHAWSFLFSLLIRIYHKFIFIFLLGFVSYDNPQCAQQGKKRKWSFCFF